MVLLYHRMVENEKQHMQVLFLFLRFGQEQNYS